MPATHSNKHFKHTKQEFLMKLYIDTNIFLDYLLDRKNLLNNDISSPAQKLFHRAINCEFFIIFSDHTAKEVYNQINIEKTFFLFEVLKKKLVTIRQTKEDQEEARKIDSNNYDDALHFVLAKKSGADFIITRNIKHFSKFDSLKAKLPENI